MSGALRQSLRYCSIEFTLAARELARLRSRENHRATAADLNEQVAGRRNTNRSRYPRLAIPTGPPPSISF